MPTQQDTATSRVSVAEELINFRPSPNFKNMKKFLKNRTEVKTADPVKNVAPAPERASTLVKKVELKEDVKVKPMLTLQPPLPPYPPPPDSPPNLDIVIKKEKVDVDETQSKDSVSGASTQGPTAQVQGHTAQVQGHTEKPKKEMCKEYVRGNCKRPMCRFEHKIYKEQLPGVYTFCWDYQNDECKYPHCKFVHANQFEEASFYRTGILPPHARSHQRKAPTPPPLEESHPQPSADPSVRAFCNPPPVHTSSDKTPVITCVPTSQIGSRPLEEEFKAPVPRSTSPQKRDWNNIETFTSSPRVLEPDHLAKKCKNCEMMAFREQYNKELVENLIKKTTEDFNKKMSLLHKKSSVLTAVLQTLLRPASSTKPGVDSIIGGEKEKTILEQLNLINGKNRFSSILNDDNLKHMHASNTLSSLAKLLRTSDLALTADARDT